jgi:peroxiredoxin
VTPTFFDDSDVARPGHAATAAGDGPDLGAAVRFDERDVVTGAPITPATLAGKRTLLFFSEGVMCQACFVQIRDLEQVGDALERRGIGLVSITPDTPRILRQAIGQYGIRTPMIADGDRDMSAAFDTLGRGMHPDTPGHAFVLLDEAGKVVWQRDYWLDPYRTMYVDPETLLADIARASERRTR